MFLKKTLDVRADGWHPIPIAHRGDASRCPENTLAALDSAREQVAAIEIDVQLSRDGVPMVFHDRTLARIVGSPGRLCEFDAHQLAEMDVGSWFSSEFSAQRMARLDDVLVRYKQTHLLIEIKIRERGMERIRRLVKATAEAIGRHERQHQDFILCYRQDVLAWAASRWPDLSYVWNADRCRLLDNDDWLSAYSVRLSGLKTGFVDAAHARGKPVWTFTCNDARQLERARACAVDGVMSDRPGWLIAALDDGALK